MVHPTSVKALSKYRIWLEFDDGISGEVDLSDVAGSGVFQGLGRTRAILRRFT